MDRSKVPVFILAGGLGTRMKEETEFRPKPMVMLGERPLLWHIMQRYSRFGFRRFVICSGFKSEVIKSYFYHYATLQSDFTVQLKGNHLTVHSMDHIEDWEVTVAFTGDTAMTGSRIAQATQKYLGDAEHFAVTYGDGITDLDLGAEFDFHLQHSSTGTVLGSNPPSRFGELKMSGSRVVEFAEKPDLHDSWINAGYFFFRRDFVKYLKTDNSCVLESDPLVSLARDGQLQIFRHPGFWFCVDTQRDLEMANKMWNSGEAPWMR